MNKRITLTVATNIIWCLLIMSVPRLAFACDAPLARQVADLLVANKVESANLLLDEFEQQQPNHPMLGLYRGAVLWAQSQNASKEDQPAAQQKAIDAMQQVIERDLQALQEDPAEPERQLSLGMAQAFIARLYLQQNKWFKAYRYGRKARDGLRDLIAQYPDQEDAYLILGLYEYHTGSVSPFWKWVTAMIDLSGDAQLGVQYIERAVQNAPVVAPEAARVLLTEVKSSRPQVCDYLSLAQLMREHYGSNPQFSVVLQDIYILCGQAEKALGEAQQAKNRYLEKYPNMKIPLDIRALIAYRELGDMQNVEAMAPRLQSVPMIWTLNKAKASDLIGERQAAIGYYQALIDDDAAPHWIQKQARKHLDQPYQRFKTRTPQRDLQLSTRCS
ncbi:hypothetical protein [Kaarinaea lacus]